MTGSVSFFIISPHREEKLSLCARFLCTVAHHEWDFYGVQGLLRLIHRHCAKCRETGGEALEK